MSPVAQEEPQTTPDTPLEEPEPTPEPEPIPEPEEEPEEPQEPSQETTEPPGESEAQMKKNLASLDKEATRHANRISEILGEASLDLEPCPRCIPNMAGFVLPLQLAPVGPEQKEAVLASIGEGTEAGILKSEITRMCEHCDGQGRWTSGSRIANLRYINCSHCKGKGYIEVGGPVTPVTVTGQNGEVALEISTPSERPPDADPWGRTPEHPDYGRLPNYVQA